MALAKPMQQYHHHHQIQQKKNGGGGGTPDVKRIVNMYMNKLSDRDTEAMAASELDLMARSISTDSLPSFLSAISDTRPSDKTPLRRHCVRLLSLLSQSHPPHCLTPLFPRMISAVVRRLRDSDSSVRTACVDAVRSMAASYASASPASASASFSSVFLRPLSESLLLEQDHNAQMGSAMCLAAAIESAASVSSSDPDRAAQLQRLLPRLIKLARSDAFKAKPSLLSLLGSVAAAGGASTPSALGILVPCLIDFLGSEDWATRKAAAEALSRVASISDTSLLANFKSSCISSYETRRFDKVKIVRDSMNQMLEAWKDLPGSNVDDGANNTATAFHSLPNSSLREIASDGRFSMDSRNASSVRSNSVSTARKNKFTVSRSPPPEASPAPTTRRNTPPRNEKRTSPPLFRKIDQKKPSDWKIEIAVPQTPALKVVCEDKQGGNGSNYRFEPKRSLFENNSDDKAKKAGSRVVPFQEIESSGSANGTGISTDELYRNNKENNDLSLIRKQLVQIENQQSSLLDLLQKFMGTSQNGIHSLETRVHGLEMALDEISHDLAVSTGRMTDPSVNACCKLPGADFLSSKFWRRTEGRYSSRFSISGSSTLAGARNSAGKESMDSFKWDRRQFGIQGGFVNPLAEVHPQSRGASDASSNGMLKPVMHDSGCSSAQDASRST